MQARAHLALWTWQDRQDRKPQQPRPSLPAGTWRDLTHRVMRPDTHACPPSKLAVAKSMAARVDQAAPHPRFKPLRLQTRQSGSARCTGRGTLTCCSPNSSASSSAGGRPATLSRLGHQPRSTICSQVVSPSKGGRGWCRRGLAGRQPAHDVDAASHSSSEGSVDVREHSRSGVAMGQFL